MYVVEFCKEDQDPDYHRVFVYTYTELMQLLNYIDKFEYTLESVHRECMFVGYEAFKDFIKNYEEHKK